MRTKEEIQEDILQTNKLKKTAVKMQIWCMGRLAELDREMRKEEDGEYIQEERKLY